MRKVHYHNWLSNAVMVKKHDGSWRMCVDFTELNKCFLDAYKGYYQIQMSEEDEEKTAFHTSQGVVFYTKMPFGLKHARATYHWLLDKSFEKQIGRNLEVYVDDPVIKSHAEQEILRDVEETFQTLRKINMKLNPTKSTFGAEEGMFLGHVINMKGIKACPDKAEAVIKLQSSRTLKEINGQVERANRNLGEGIKVRLGEENKNWVEEVSHVLWAHHTTIKTSNGHTSFSLTYGTEAVIPVEIGIPSLRYATIDQAINDEALLLNLDILEEEREKAAIQEEKSKAKMEKYYNAKVRSTTFKPGDFVYRSNEASHNKEGRKLGPKWEGPYEVVEALGKGAYKIRNDSGDILPRTWNV
ncbi:reverse transcriptase domain-containing protein [Tanacetum coccineum]